MNIAGFAEISGLTGAFGYNMDLTLPTLHNITYFPLLNPPSPGSGEDLETPVQLVAGYAPPFSTHRMAPCSWPRA